MNNQINIRLSVAEVESLIEAVRFTPPGSTKDFQASNKLAACIARQLHEQRLEQYNNRCESNIK